MIRGITTTLRWLKEGGCNNIVMFYFGREMCATHVRDFEKCL